MLEQDPTDSFVMKRQICIQKASGNITKAIELINRYLSVFMADETAWAELADLYLSLQQYKQAAFCYEELILCSPYTSHIHLRYAEILYSIGGTDNYRTARKYFAYSLELNPNSVRSMIGLCLLIEKDPSKKEEDRDLIALMISNVRKAYSTTGNQSIVGIIVAVLQKLLPTKK